MLMTAHNSHVLVMDRTFELVIQPPVCGVVASGKRASLTASMTGHERCIGPICRRQDAPHRSSRPGTPSLMSTPPPGSTCLHLHVASRGVSATSCREMLATSAN